jgi:hypothetical protein
MIKSQWDYLGTCIYDVYSPDEGIKGTCIYNFIIVIPEFTELNDGLI